MKLHSLGASYNVVHKINIRGLSKDELIHLNHLIIERLKELRRFDAAQKISVFNLFDLVLFGSGKNQQYAIILKINQKTISIICEDDQRWNVSPELISKVKLSPNKAREIMSRKFTKIGTVEEIFAH